MNYYYPYSEQPQSSYYQLRSEDYDLKIRQQPRDALLAQDGKEKSRKPVDPPPIIEVTVREAADPVRQFLQSPYLFMTCTLVPGDEGFQGAQATDEKGLCGTMVSSLHKLKDIDNKDGGFFVFGDVSVKRLGEHRLLFSLYELSKIECEVVFLRSILSEAFTVHPQKEYPGLEESTHLSRTFADQGVRLRLRKEARTAGGGSSRKRSYPSYTSQAGSSQAGSSSRIPVSRASTSFGASPVIPSSYEGYSEPESKRHQGQYGGYSSGQSISSPTALSNVGGYPGTYSATNPGQRLQAQTVPSQMGGSGGQRYSQMYAPGPTSSPVPPSGEFGFRSPYSRIDPSEPSQQQSSIPLTGYDRGASAGYGSGGLPQMSTLQAPLNPSTTLNAGASAFQPQAMSYGHMSDPSGYSSYSQQQQQQQQQQYRNDQQAYPSHQGSFSPDNQIQQPYGDLSTAYPGSYDPNQGRTGYQPPTSRSWR